MDAQRLEGLLNGSEPRCSRVAAALSVKFVVFAHIFFKEMWKKRGSVQV